MKKILFAVALTFSACIIQPEENNIEPVAVQSTEVAQDTIPVDTVLSQESDSAVVILDTVIVSSDQLLNMDSVAVTSVDRYDSSYIDIHPDQLHQCAQYSNVKVIQRWTRLERLLQITNDGYLVGIVKDTVLSEVPSCTRSETKTIDNECLVSAMQCRTMTDCLIYLPEAPPVQTECY